jgi:hypothetical protein
MAKRTIVRFACVVVMLGVLAASAATLSATMTRLTYITFSGPVGLPGIVLPAGTYAFDRPSPFDPTVVRVMDRSQSKLYLITITRGTHRRMDGNLKTAITLGEAPKGQVQPIKAWFPEGLTLGNEFIYSR